MNSIFIYLLQASICLTLSFLFYHLLLARLTFFHWNRFFLLFLTLASYTLPLLSISSLSWHNVGNANEFMYFYLLSNETFLISATDFTSEFTPYDYLLILYFAVALFFLVKLILQVLMVIYIVRHAQVQRKDGFCLVHSNGALTTSSFFHYIFLTEQRLTENEYHQVMQHELVHVRQKHSWDLLFFRLLCVIFWFNPFAYLLARSAEEVHEYLADEGATKDYSPTEYARLMLKLATESPSLATVHHFYQVQLKNRVIMLNKLKSTPMEKFKFFLAIPLIGIMFLLFSFDQSQTKVEDLLIGSWQGTDFTFEQTEGPELSQAMIEGGRALHIGGSFLLKQDKTYEIKDLSGATNGKGTWGVKDKNILVTKTAGGELVHYQIQKLDKNKLIAKQQVETEIPGSNSVSKGTIKLTYVKR